MNAKHEEIVRVNGLRAERDRLEREAEWLAERLEEACKGFRSTRYGCLDCPFFLDDAAYCLYEEKPWREAARIALEEEDKDRRGFYQEGRPDAH